MNSSFVTNRVYDLLRTLHFLKRRRGVYIFHLREAQFRSIEFLPVNHQLQLNFRLTLATAINTREVRFENRNIIQNVNIRKSNYINFYNMQTSFPSWDQSLRSASTQPSMELPNLETSNARTRTFLHGFPTVMETTEKEKKHLMLRSIIAPSHRSLGRVRASLSPRGRNERAWHPTPT